MKNNLFNKSLLKKYAEKKAFDLTIPKHKFLKTHAEKVENNDFKAERSSYLYFYDFLKEILGYDRDKNILFEDKESIGRGKVEFVLKSTDPEHKFMVIELKDQNTDLDKPQTRANDKRSPVDQAFSYAQHSDIANPVDWIMVSNFKEFRLYNYNKRSGKCICFTYEDLLDKEKFKYFMVAFSKKSHIEKGYPKKILKETLVIEKKLEHNFYKLFHETRLMLITELEEINDLSREESVHYAQLILNRYMFIAFAEDTGLLTSQISTDTIVSPIKNNNLLHNTIWQRLNELFEFINVGNPHKDIPAYNGGLFEEDLSFIKIRDTIENQQIFKDTWQEWNFDEAYGKDIQHLVEPYSDITNPIYKNLLTISSFDFSSELDVNILGHIFENSIGDLEELKADTKGRRKKEGIFYTPEYITDYICKNTIIPYLSKSGNINEVEELIEEYSWGNDIEELDKKLSNIKIVDPACGSGAFLNKATDILLEIHEAIFDFKKGITKKTQMRVGRGKRRKTEDITHFDLGTIVFDAIEKRREILLENIYGVDLNEESVEITKLSLFLKVCKKDKKLPALDKNIKCGNSLIDDSKYTNKPFNWKKEFPDVFEKGGFNVVIGNPPYVRQEKIKEIKPYLKEKYVVYTGVADLYVYFFEKGLDILKDEGIFSFICSDKFTKANYGKPLRMHLLKKEILKYIDYSGKNVFEEARVDPCVIIIKKSFSENNNILVNDSFCTPQKRLNKGSWSFEPVEALDLKDKIQENSGKLKDIEGLKINFGVKTGFNEAFIIDKQERDQLIYANSKNDEIIRPLIRGKDIKKWSIFYKNIYLIWTYMGVQMEDYPEILKYLNQYEDRLKRRGDKGNYYWELRPCDYYSEFEKEKIVWSDMTIYPAFSLDKKSYLSLNTAYILTLNNENYDLNYILTLLNSKLLFWVFKGLGSGLGREGLRYFKKFVELLPIYPAKANEQQPFIQKSKKMLQLNNNLQEELGGFTNWLITTFGIERLSMKLEKYYELTFDEFIEEIRKKKVDVRSRKNQELLEDEYQKSLEIVNPLLQEIELTDVEIDQMVYELYGLTDEEIQIVEESLAS